MNAACVEGAVRGRVGWFVSVGLWAGFIVQRRDSCDINDTARCVCPHERYRLCWGSCRVGVCGYVRVWWQFACWCFYYVMV